MCIDTWSVGATYRQRRSIVTEYVPSRDIYRYKLGYYASTEEANQVIKKLVEFGFNGAHITN